MTSSTSSSPTVSPQKERLTRRLERRRKERNRKIAFSLIVVLVLGFAGYLLFKAFYQPPLPPAVGNTVDISAAMDGFSMKEIRVKVGQPVTIRLRSLDNSAHTDGGGKHQWAVDDFKVSIIAPPEGVAQATFTPTKTGEFDYYCDICCGGRANPEMHGKLIVEA